MAAVGAAVATVRSGAGGTIAARRYARGGHARVTWRREIPQI